ncbi:MAG: thioredoxin domain-containing protein [Pyrinomonadaceae bacterium]
MKKFLTIIVLVALACMALAARTQTRQPATKSRAQNPVRSPATRATPTQAKPVAPATASPSPVVVNGGLNGGLCGCESGPLPEVIATVNGVNLSQLGIDERVKEKITELQKNVIDARQSELNLQINTKLLAAEAKKRGRTTAKLLEEEIMSKVVEPTEAEAQAFYDANKEKINGEFQAVKANVIGYLRGQRQDEQSKLLADKLRASAQVKILVPVPTPPANAAERARVFAVVNGEQITSADIEDALRPLIFRVQQETYHLRRNDVDLRINDALLEQEAQKRKTTTNALLDAEINTKVKPVTEAEARTFYDQNKGSITEDFAVIKDQLVQYLQDTQKQNLQSVFAAQLRQTAALQVFLLAPEAPVLKIATDDQPAKGNPAAPVTIVEFTDYQCSSCANAQTTLDRLTAEYGDRVRLVVRDFPLEQHEHARKAAEAAEAARAQGKYWEYAALLFANQTALSVDKLKEYATRAGLDRQKFDALLDSGQFAEKVQQDLLDGLRLGVNSTPSFFINGRISSDRTYEGLKAAIDKALGEKGRK